DDVGMDFGVADPEHLVMTADGVHWNGERLAPERDVIVYDIRSEPVHEIDLWSSITAVRSLEALGFWLAIPLATAIACADKFATAELLADSPIPVIPSVRITTGRDIHRLRYHHLIPDSWFPVFAKPASWGRGLGCVRCPDRPTLDAVLGLASGSGACMLVQPAIGEVVSDLRVAVVGGEVVAAYDRIPGDSSHVANVSRGGSVRERTSLDPEIHELVRLVDERLRLPYVCIDLLCTADGRTWFSELEPDGAVSGLFSNPDAVRRVVGGRFRAYAAGLDTHLETGLLLMSGGNV
ncbi:MAG: RimK family alpha-L-glutamate ligase, partial [Catenulispora sp.]